MQRKMFWIIFVLLGLVADFLLPFWWACVATVPILFLSLVDRLPQRLVLGTLLLVPQVKIVAVRVSSEANSRFTNFIEKGLPQCQVRKTYDKHAPDDLCERLFLGVHADRARDVWQKLLRAWEWQRK